MHTFCLASHITYRKQPAQYWARLSIIRMAEQQPGFYCSTSGTFFADKVLQAVIVTFQADLELLAIALTVSHVKSISVRRLGHHVCRTP